MEIFLCQRKVFLTSRLRLETSNYVEHTGSKKRQDIKRYHRPAHAYKYQKMMEFRQPIRTSLECADP